ncbi:signal peptidase I [Bacillus xiapuensis]|uniref:Signal peptidase I n=1 Tax=Bacillus xiapuensis TaxID=2014075 RepID=A0ABU6NEM9_9BACI|nr:signal peptidase I [Bacillus xiapuensis]
MDQEQAKLILQDIIKIKSINPPGNETLVAKKLKSLQTAVGKDVVPAGHLFVMGDNRRISRDSRHIGAISMKKVIGTAKIVFYPVKEIKIIGK